ncbi:hypothetical protein [Microbacterium sp. 77mftsu3.1]|uniref:hypothetical protein n=1 Tax=Microbacterium sp. 77mftsu3.1 TaxID=1761802 RepID=UPI0003A4614F|nr:hypothetical protein [Microbacterium sp. 77mftsu3.1]SDH39134.1 hypothetical protein SAMN04488590_3215 [Microbacterium sp. 77mftsu3.1]
MTEITTEVRLFPDGMELDDVNAPHFTVKVAWRGARSETGRGGYAVIQGGDRHLSRAGNWRYNPEPRLQRHYRWETLEEALEVARSVVNSIKVMGRTWTQWQKESAEGETRRAAEAAS